MKSVLYIIGTLSGGGAQRVLCDYILNRQRLQNYRMSVFVLGSKGESVYEKIISNENIQIEYGNIKDGGGSLFSSVLRMIKSQFVICKVLTRMSPDIVHTHVSDISMHMVLPIILVKTKKVFHTMHSDPFHIRFRDFIFTYILFHWLNVHPIAVTEKQAQRAIKRYRLDDCDILNNNIDVKKIKKKLDHVTKRHIKESYSIDSNTYVIGTVGRLNKVKNYDGLIKIFRKYIQRKPNSMLVLVGDGPEYGVLKQLAENLHVSSKVLFLGNINSEEVYKIYKMFDLFIMTSHSEACPMVSLEAQLAGCKCLFSYAIPDDIAFTRNVHFMSKNASIDDWVAAMEQDKFNYACIKSVSDIDITYLISKLERIYDKY